MCTRAGHSQARYGATSPESYLWGEPRVGLEAASNRVAPVLWEARRKRCQGSRALGLGSRGSPWGLVSVEQVGPRLRALPLPQSCSGHLLA